jgi:hypothetical protein
MPSIVDVDDVWSALSDVTGRHDLEVFEVAVRDDGSRAAGSKLGFVETASGSSITWMRAVHRPPVSEMRDGFVVVDCRQRADLRHP